MKSRTHLAVVAVVAALTVLLGACGGSDGNAKSAGEKAGDTKKSETTVKNSGGSEDGTDKPTSGATKEPLSDSAFASRLDKVNATITSAGKDPCKISAAQNTEPPAPTNSAQVAKVVETYSLLLRSMAGVLPAASAESAKALNNAADAVEKAAKDAKYPKDFFGSEELSKAMSQSGVNEGISAFAKTTKGCPGSADMSAASPNG